MIKVLILVFVLLSLLAGGDRTAKSLMTTLINISIFALLIEFIYLGFNIAITTIAAALLISAVTIFYQNESNIKTVSAFVSVIIVLALSYLWSLMPISKVSEPLVMSKFSHLTVMKRISELT